MHLVGFSFQLDKAMVTVNCEAVEMEQAAAASEAVLELLHPLMVDPARGTGEDG